MPSTVKLMHSSYTANTTKTRVIKNIQFLMKTINSNYTLVFLCVFIILPTNILLVPIALPSPVAGSSLKYDQSQAGDYNVQVHLKNIEVYAILDDGALGNEVST